MSYQNRASSMLNDYANIRSLPAMLSVAFIAASLYQFGGISTIELTWIGGTGGYALTAAHSVIISLAALGVAFASSETKQFEHYEDWEKVAIAAGPLVIVGHEYTTEITDVIVEIDDPLGYQLAFLLTVVSWGIAVQ